MMALSQWPQLLPAPTRQPRHLGPAGAPHAEVENASQGGCFQSPEYPEILSPVPSAERRVPTPLAGQWVWLRGPAKVGPGPHRVGGQRWHRGGVPSPPAGRPARRPPRPAYPGPGPQTVPPAARLSPPVCPRSSCSSRCSHALPSSQFLTSWSHPPRCNHTALCKATGGREGRGGELGAERWQPPERPRRSNASLARRKPGAAGRGVRGGAAGGGRRQPRSAAPGSASAGSERAASVRRVQLS